MAFVLGPEDARMGELLTCIVSRQPAITSTQQDACARNMQVTVMGMAGSTQIMERSLDVWVLNLLRRSHKADQALEWNMRTAKV